MPLECFCKDPALPFAECRYTTRSQSVFKPHMHTSVSIGAVDEGLVRYSVGDRVASLRPGSLALINPETLHACNTLPATSRSYYMLYLDPAWCLTVQQSLWKVETFVPFAVIRLEDAPLYYRYCHIMQQLLAPDVHLQEKEQALVELFTAVMQKGCKQQFAREEPAGDIVQLKKLLQEDLHKDLTLDSLAAILGANPYTMLRKFKAETGITPHAYRMNCRIELAKSHLRAGRDIAETALECGFFDQSHLHRHFRDMTTVTPLAYRSNFT